MTAMGLRLRKLPVKADDSNWLEAKELFVEMTAMGLRQRELPIKADDSDGIEAEEIACQGQ
jgi:hypothetical protein